MLTGLAVYYPTQNTLYCKLFTGLRPGCQVEISGIVSHAHNRAHPSLTEPGTVTRQCIKYARLRSDLTKALSASSRPDRVFLVTRLRLRFIE